MKLPNAHLAIVEEAKVREYLLDEEHRYGGSKARFLAGFGFTLEPWELLAAALREHGGQHMVVKMRETGFGPRFEIEGEMSAPDGRRPRMRTVWQIDQGRIAPRLLSAYPLEAL